ncbi:MAG: IPT/TIG domain-containing protein [Treponema sp.]|jgi:transglutaminase-like putative cysteine protease|nr:IPT/TIG domain-containing protein [Treponema sp.]
MNGLFVLIPLLFFASCREKNPVVSSVDPRIGTAGEVLTIRGEHFGARRDESYITIAGTSPTSSSYLSWEDDHISLRIPEFVESGLLYVWAGGKKSNGVLFSNRAGIPRPAQGVDMGIGPRIASVNPQSGPVGSLVTITGSGFGSSRERGGVYFAWNAEPSAAAPAEARRAESVEVFEAEFGYELWSEREIRVRVPDGAVGGNLEVRTPRGNSRPVYFDVSGKPGTKTYGDKRSYTISYSVNIQVNEASEPNSLYLWIPQPVSSASQRGVDLLSRSAEPFVDNYRGTSLFQLNNLRPRSQTGIALSYHIEVYSLETALQVQSIKSGGDSPVDSVYLLPGPLIPSDDPRIKALAAGITGKERNPYLKARQIYDWLIREGNIRQQVLSGGALEALDQKRADPYAAALLFCALCRAAGISAIPVSGVLVNRGMEAARHYWAEFWIGGFGWVPADPALGAGAAPPSFSLREDRGAYYFGNLDNQRITFSRGETLLSRMDVRGRAAYRTREYALQNLWEEAVGGLESYSSFWGDVTITGMYVQ